MSITVLFVEQSDLVRKKIARDMSEHGLSVTPFSANDGKMPGDSEHFDVAVIAEPTLRSRCVESVQALRKTRPTLPIILLADSTTSVTTIDALRSHIFTFLVKPLDSAELVRAIDEAVRDGSRQGLRIFDVTEGAAVGEPIGRIAGPAPVVRSSSRGDAGGLLVGESAAIEAVRRQIDEAAQSDLAVLIQGESGVGKGIVARMIHDDSPRRDRDNFITINCPAIPKALMDSELFGHQVGAFTGADVAKPGRLEMAQHGTVFMDEIGDIPPSVQAKLLEVMETHEIVHVGGKKAIKIDVRFIAATNASLPKMIQEGRFRSELFYRINEFHIYIPPLRERIEDIPLLVKHFVQQFAVRLGRRGLSIPHEALPAMMRYAWPGNVRELETLMRRYALTEKIEEILRVVDQAPAADGSVGKGSLLDQNQVQVLLSVLTQTRWNQRKAAKILGISYSALRRRIERYELKDCPLEQVARPVSSGAESMAAAQARA